LLRFHEEDGADALGRSFSAIQQRSARRIVALDDFATIVATALEAISLNDPARERCWIAEKDGERIGSVFLVKRKQERPRSCACCW